MSLSETIPINLFSLSTIGTAPIFLFLISRAISLTGVSLLKEKFSLISLSPLSNLSFINLASP